MEEMFKKVKAVVKKEVPAHTYTMWIDPVTFHSSESDRMVLGAPNFFIKKRFLSLYLELVTGTFKKLTGKSYKIKLLVTGKAAPRKTADILAPSPQQQLPNMDLKPHSGRLLRRDFTFDQFVVSNNNDFAYSAALSHATRKLSTTPTLMLLSKSGMGKSHLSQAIGHHILSKRPTDRVFYMTAEDFSNEMVQSYRTNTLNQFKEKYRSKCDVLLLEDVHFLTGKDRTQVELSTTLDSLNDSGKHIIFTSCCTPREIPKLSAQLKSRLSAGLITQIESPNFRTRVRILQKKAAARGIHLPMDVIQFLAEELSEDVRQLESGLIGVAARSSLLGQSVNLSLAQSVLKTIIQEKKALTIESIKGLVCRQFKISPKEIMSKSRRQDIVRPRQIAMYLSRRHTDAPLQAIGKCYNRYHATALHAINFIESEMKRNSQIKTQVEYLEKRLHDNTA
jgi:chromosomal replication initiator protein